MSFKKYFMGIDIGTNYNGWAVSNDEYKIINKNGKNLWGVYAFDEAETQKERRLNRSNVNRLNRRKERIKLLQNLFNAEISNVDPLFFKKLDSSFCKIETPKDGLKYNLFSENNFNDASYYSLYPTIYHLRKELLEKDEKKDVRLIYLAVHHIIKYRGHFTLENQNFNIDNIDLVDYFIKINNFLAEKELDVEFNLENINNEKIKYALIMPKGISYVKKALLELFKVNDKCLTAILSLLSGGIVKITDLFINSNYADLEEFKKICFRDAKFIENQDNLEQILGDDYELIKYIKEIYDYSLMKKLLGDNLYISSAMVARYDKHKSDLKKLKTYLINNKTLYNKIFRNYKISNNYPNYIGSNITSNSKITLKHASAEDFYNFLIKELDLKNTNDEFLMEVYNDIQNDNYLPRLNTKDNAVFPYQINEYELEKILNNQVKYYPFLLDKDEYGTVKDKIISLLKFRVPYYVGHLNNKSRTSWVVRTREKIYPWNFDKVVNKDATAINFIRRMTNTCSYLYDQETLPANSLIYMKYLLLDEINKINVNGDAIKYEDKQALINDLFMQNKNVNYKQLLNYFKIKYGKDVVVTTSNNKEITEIKCSLSSHVIFKNIFKEKFSEMQNTIEAIINEITIFEDKDILAKRLINVYDLTREEVNQIKGLNFKGFGKLSNKLLCGLKTEIVNELGEVKEKSILDLMEETNDNFMEIIYNPKYSFKAQLEVYNVIDDTINYKYIENLPTSPANKRSIWSALKIVNEVESILKSPIDKFFIECTRGEKPDLDNKSRKKFIDENYKAVSKTLSEIDFLSKNEFTELCNELDATDNKKIRSKKLFLYFLQLGKCMYTGNPISINSLFTNDYDIDHIIPRSLVKDDSMDNLVLVESKANKAKSDIYPIPDSVISPKARVLWSYLQKNKLITTKKYNSLIRKEELNENELVGFINRQLVFTNQMVKILVNILKVKNPNCEVIWSKAGNISEFRNKIDFLKCREANNLHHAHDAYLNIVVGNVFNTKYGYEMNVERFKKFKEKRITMNTDKIYDYDVKGKNGYYAWDCNKTKDIILKQLNSTYIPVIHKETTNSGRFYKETIYSPKEGKKLVPLKGKGLLSDTKKYGGYSNVEFSHFVLIKYSKKNKEQFTLVPIPVLIAKDKDAIRDYISQEKGLNEFDIILDKIKKNTILEIDGFEYRIRGEKDRASNVEVYWRQEQIKYIRQVIKVSQLSLNDELEKYNMINKIDNLKLYNEIIKRFSNKPFNKCSVLQNLSIYMQNNVETFENLTLENQCKILYNIMVIQETQPSRASLELINGPKDFGRIMGTTNVNPGTKIISISITGYYEKVLFEI